MIGSPQTPFSLNQPPTWEPLRRQPSHRCSARRRSFLIETLLVISIVSSHLNAQRQNITIGTLTNDFGISVKGEHCIVQDREGFLWFGAYNGLYKYDGYNFTAYRHDPENSNSISSDQVDAIYEDASGTLWVGTSDAGLNRFDRRTEHFTHYGHDPRDSTSLGNDNVHAIIESRDGVLWLALFEALDEFDRNSGVFKHHRHISSDTNSLSFHDVSTVFEDRSGTIWAGTWSGGLDAYDRQQRRFIHFRHYPSDPSSLGDDRVHSIFESNDGSLWVGTWYGGLNRFDRKTKRFTRFTYHPSVSETISDNCITSILQTSDGTLWVGTWGGGLNRFDQARSAFVSYTYGPSGRNTLCDNKVASLCEDRSGILWVGTWSGVNCIDLVQKQFIHHTARPGRYQGGGNDYVTAILHERSGELWVGSVGGGLDRFDLQHQQYRKYLHSTRDPRSLSSDDVFAIYRDRAGVLWVGSNQLNRFDEKIHAFRRYEHNPADSNSLGGSVTSILEDRRGILWIGTFDFGLDEFDREKGRFRHHRHSFDDPHTLGDNHVNTIFEDRRGTLWIGTRDGGLDRYDREENRFWHYTHDPDVPTSLASNEIIAIYEDKSGGFWVRSQKGWDRFDRETATAMHYTQDDGLPRGTFRSIKEDSKSNLWFSNMKGIVKVNRDTHIERTYTSSEWFNPEEFGRLNGVELSNGNRVFLGSMHGFVSFVPDSIKENSFIPPVAITSVKRNNRGFSPAVILNQARELELSYVDRVVSFEFAALSYREPERNQYAYMLQGFDGKWNYCGTRRVATYTNLDPGTYTFRVKGSNHDGVWNEAGTSLTVIVNPAFWQAWWFKLLAALAFLALSAFIYEREVTRLKRDKLIQQGFSRQLIELQEAGRKRLAADLHDGLGQDLLVASNELQQFLQENKPYTQELNQVASLLQESIESVREIAADLHPHQLDRLGFCVALEAMTENLSGSSGLTIQRSCDDIDHVMPEEVEIHVYRIIQEALANVARHASAKNVNVQMRKTSGSIQITLTDDGKGFDIRKATEDRPFPASSGWTHGFGLSTMSERARIIGATLTIDSAPGSGTTVRITLPYP